MNFTFMRFPKVLTRLLKILTVWICSECQWEFIFWNGSLIKGAIRIQFKRISLVAQVIVKIFSGNLEWQGWWSMLKWGNYFRTASIRYGSIRLRRTKSVPRGLYLFELTVCVSSLQPVTWKFWPVAEETKIEFNKIVDIFPILESLIQVMK